MKPQLALGDRVKLNERGMRLGARRGWAKIDWPNRRGTVRHITKQRGACAVGWPQERRRAAGGDP
jgi:hypothetical protein